MAHRAAASAASSGNAAAATPPVRSFGRYPRAATASRISPLSAATGTSTYPAAPASSVRSRASTTSATAISGSASRRTGTSTARRRSRGSVATDSTAGSIASAPPVTTRDRSISATLAAVSEIRRSPIRASGQTNGPVMAWYQAPWCLAYPATASGIARLAGGNSDASSNRPRSSVSRAAVWLLIRAPGNWPSESTLSGPVRCGVLAYVLRENHGVPQIVPGGPVEFSAAGNKAQRRPARIAVDGPGRKIRFQVQRRRINPENGRLPVFQGDVDEVARPELTQVVEDRRADLGRIDVPEDHRRARLPGRRPPVVPAGQERGGQRRHGRGTAGRQAQRDDLRPHADARDVERGGNGPRHRPDQRRPAGPRRAPRPGGHLGPGHLHRRGRQRRRRPAQRAAADEGHEYARGHRDRDTRVEHPALSAHQNRMGRLDVTPRPAPAQHHAARNGGDAEQAEPGDRQLADGHGGRRAVSGRWSLARNRVHLERRGLRDAVVAVDGGAEGTRPDGLRQGHGRDELAGLGSLLHLDLRRQPQRAPVQRRRRGIPAARQ